MARDPDAAARALSHLIVMVAVAALVKSSATKLSPLVAGLVAAGAHEAADAPLAQLLSQNGV